MKTIVGTCIAVGVAWWSPLASARNAEPFLSPAAEAAFDTIQEELNLAKQQIAAAAHPDHMVTSHFVTLEKFPPVAVEDKVMHVAAQQTLGKRVSSAVATLGRAYGKMAKDVNGMVDGRRNTLWKVQDALDRTDMPADVHEEVTKFVSEIFDANEAFEEAVLLSARAAEMASKISQSGIAHGSEAVLVEQRAEGGVESTAAMLKGAALEELHLGVQGSKTLASFKKVEKKVDSLLTGAKSDIAKEVEELLHVAERDQAKVAKGELLDARRELRLAHRQASGHKHHKASMIAVAGKTNAVASLRARAARQAAKRMDQGEKLFFQSEKVDGEVKHTRAVLSKALAGTSIADEVGGLLSRAQHAADQVLVAEGKQWVSAAKQLQDVDPKAAERKAKRLQRRMQ